jgi:hypothetical protein
VALKRKIKEKEKDSMSKKAKATKDLHLVQQSDVD